MGEIARTWCLVRLSWAGSRFSIPYQSIRLAGRIAGRLMMYLVSVSWELPEMKDKVRMSRSSEQNSRIMACQIECFDAGNEYAA